MTISFTTSFFRKSLMSWTNSLLRRFKSSLREALFSEMNNLSPCRRTFSVYFTKAIVKVVLAKESRDNLLQGAFIVKVGHIFIKNSTKVVIFF